MIRRLAIPRRAFLRGLGASLALPWLGAMVPALDRGIGEGAQPRRAVFVFHPNGKKMDEWTPPSHGALGELPWLLEPLAPHRRQVTVVSGLALDGARAHGDGPGDHARAAAAFLTGAHPKKTGGSDIRIGVSVDQMIASKIGSETRFPSLELGCEGGRQAGICDSGYACAYVSNISWRTESLPMVKEVDPRQVFTRLFGDPDHLESAADREQRRKQRLGILDAAMDDARTLKIHLGPGDRRKLEEYLDAVRELEQRLERTEPEAAEVELPEGLSGGKAPRGFSEQVDLMYELIALALQADLTRTVTLMLGNAGSNRSYRFLDVPEGHHDLSHHGKDEHKLAQLRKVNRFHVERFAGFLARLSGIREGGGNLLDASMIVYGSGIGDGNAHNHDRLPVLLAGGGGGTLRGGRHLVMSEETPLANLHLALLDRLNVRVPAFGDSTGRLAL